MKNLLSDYLDKRLHHSKTSHADINKPGPVITISREVGCNGLKLAHPLAQELNKKSGVHKWKVLSKEIFHQSAKELDLDYNRISKIFKNSERYTFEEILHAFNNKNYKSERKIIKTVKEVVWSFAVDGYCIIVGRAGHIIARDITNAVHLRFIAPLEFRIKTIMENNALSRGDAIEFIKKVEKERIAFRKALKEDTLSEYDFDLIINRGTFNRHETIDLILKAVKEKQLLKATNSKAYLL